MNTPTEATPSRSTVQVALFDLPNQCADVIRHPERYAHLPCLLQDAWMAAKEAQGQPITPDRLLRLPAIVPVWTGDRHEAGAATKNSVEAMIASVTGRTRARIRKHATSQGYHLISTDTPGGAV